MLIFSAKSSAARRRILSSVLAFAICGPAVPGLLPDSVAALLPGEPVVWAAPATPATPLVPPENRNDPGAQLSRVREYMERQRIAQQMEEDWQRQKAGVETQGQKPEQGKEQITFRLAKVETDPSEILAEEEIRAITDPYVGKTVSLQDLYGMTDAINKLYEEKGYSICKAYIPPQRIHGGTVQIKLLEGKTGNVTVDGLRFTRKSYVTNRIRLEPGKVANTDRLNEQLQRFNATNDVQLRVLVHAGEVPGTTDYEIAAMEPKTNHAVALYLDNNGYETSGRWREGIFYTMRSLTGQRDSLQMNYVRSQGTNVVGLNYSLPVNNRGTRLDFDYGTNTTELTKGDLADTAGMKGHSWVTSLTLRHPLRVDQKRRYEIGLQFLHQNSETDVGTKINNYNKVVDDSRNSFAPYISFAQYGKSSVLYHKHTLAYNRLNNIGDTGDNYWVYRLDAIYQKRFGGGQMLSGRFNGQVANESKIMSSADMFYIGGSGSVRGYEESFLTGSQGFNASLSYLAPLDKKRIFNAFTFVDYGRVFGDEREPDRELISTGLGLTANYKNFYSNLTLGIPLKRSFKGQPEKVDRTRIHFNCSVTF